MRACVRNKLACHLRVLGSADGASFVATGVCVFGQSPRSCNCFTPSFSYSMCCVLEYVQQ